MSRPAIVLATASVAIGLLVMVLTLCISIGFKQEIHDKIRLIDGDMHLLNINALRSGEPCPLAVSDSAIATILSTSGIKSARRIVSKLGCLKTDSAFVGIRLTCHDTISAGNIVISEVQAAQLGATKGSRLMAYFFDSAIRARRFTVSGTYATHMNEFDNMTVFASYSTVHQLTGYNKDQCDYIQITDSIPDSDERTMQLLKEARAVIPFTVKQQSTLLRSSELHPAIYSWHEMLNTNVWVILALMLAVSGFTMISGLIILILERTRMIGLLKAMGARNSTLQYIFLYLGGRILITGMAIGNAVALALAFIQQHWHIIRLNPADYYLDAVPIAYPITYIIILNICTLILTVLILLAPTKIISRISPVRVLHFE